MIMAKSRKYKEVECPVCGYLYSLDDYEYCPNCAAKDVDIFDLYPDDEEEEEIDYNNPF